VPGGRLLGSISPAIVFKDKKPYFATGSSGGTPNTFYTILNVLAWDKSFKEAQDAPRLLNFYNPTTLQDLDIHRVTMEHRISESEPQRFFPDPRQRLDQNNGRDHQDRHPGKDAPPAHYGH